MTHSATHKKQYRELKPDRPIADDLGPLISRGWIVVRGVWRHPIEALRGLIKWSKLARLLRSSPGMNGYEYMIALRPFAVGVQVLWKDRGCEMEFYRSVEHKEIALWSLRSVLTPAMLLEHFTATESKSLHRISGFYFFETESDLPPDRLMPFAPDMAKRGG